LRRGGDEGRFPKGLGPRIGEVWYSPEARFLVAGLSMQLGDSLPEGTAEPSPPGEGSRSFILSCHDKMLAKAGRGCVQQRGKSRPTRFFAAFGLDRI